MVTLSHSFPNGPRISCFGNVTRTSSPDGLHGRMLYCHGEKAIRQPLCLMLPAPTRESAGFGEIITITEVRPGLRTTAPADGVFVPAGIKMTVGLQVADCAPVVLHVPAHGTYVLHCGRPAVAPRPEDGQNLLDDVLAHTGHQRGQAAENVLAWVGPHISVEHFLHLLPKDQLHVAPFFRLHQEHPHQGVLRHDEERGRVWIDLQAVLQISLKGVQVAWQNPCTFGIAGLASYRRQPNETLTNVNLVLVHC